VNTITRHHHPQGSNDLHTWLDLRRHRGDSTIRLPGQYGSWPVTGPAASMPFRAFRLLLLEPTQVRSQGWWQLWSNSLAAPDVPLLVTCRHHHHHHHQSPTHPWAFCLSSMEFYGYFLRR
jgi:hypothetical protein